MPKDHQTASTHTTFLESQIYTTLCSTWVFVVDQVSCDTLSSNWSINVRSLRDRTLRNAKSFFERTQQMTVWASIEMTFECMWSVYLWKYITDPCLRIFNDLAIQYCSLATDIPRRGGAEILRRSNSTFDCTLFWDQDWYSTSFTPF